jgi:hypothetical protein
MTSAAPIRTLLLAGLLGSVAACGAGDDDAEIAAGTDGPVKEEPGGAAASEAPDDVCALLTPADLERAFLSPFDAGDPAELGPTGGVQCSWTNLDAPPVKLVSLTVYVDDATRAAMGRGVAELFELERSFATDPQPIDLGDDAYLSGSTVRILLGDVSVDLTTSGSSDLAVDGAVALAELVVEQL